MPDYATAQKKPLVSGIVTTHNRAALLCEALDSMYAQEGVGVQFELEVIVVDDASTDSTPEVVGRYPGVKYIRLPTNRRLPAARNAGIRASSGAYVAFLDDDDLWLPSKLSRQVPVLEARPDVGIVYGQNIVRSGNDEYVWPDSRRAPSGFVFRALLMDHFFGPGVHCFLVRREAFQKAGYLDESLTSAEDYDMWVRLAFQFPFVFVPGVVAIYRSSPTGDFRSSAASGRAEEPVRRVYEKALAMLPDSEAFAEMKQEARAHLELRIANQMFQTGQFDRAQAFVIASLRMFPGIVEDRSVREFVTRIARGTTGTAASHSSIDLGRIRSAEFKAAIGARTNGFYRRKVLGKLLGALWAGIAADMSSGPEPNTSLAWQAKLLAILHDPSLVIDLSKLKAAIPRPVASVVRSIRSRLKAVILRPVAATINSIRLRRSGPDGENHGGEGNGSTMTATIHLRARGENQRRKVHF
jgi:GT2 family glycosyltransferase